MQKTLGLVTVTGERQSEAIKNFTVHIHSTICVIIDESNKLKKQSFCNLILRVDFIFSALQKFGY